MSDGKTEDLLDIGKRHFRSRLAGGPEPLYIPQWDVTVYIKPAVNLLEMSEVLQLSREGKTAEAMCLTLMQRVRDADGNPHFRKMQKTEMLRDLDPDVLSFILAHINKDEPDEDEIEKN